MSVASGNRPEINKKFGFIVLKKIVFNCNKFICKVNLSHFNITNIKDNVFNNFYMNNLKLMIR